MPVHNLHVLEPPHSHSAWSITVRRLLTTGVYQGQFTLALTPNLEYTSCLKLGICSHNCLRTSSPNHQSHCLFVCYLTCMNAKVCKTTSLDITQRISTIRQTANVQLHDACRIVCHFIVTILLHVSLQVRPAKTPGVSSWTGRNNSISFVLLGRKIDPRLLL